MAELTVREYAQKNHFSERRVRELLGSGKLNGRKAGKKWLILENQAPPYGIAPDLDPEVQRPAHEPPSPLQERHLRELEAFGLRLRDRLQLPYPVDMVRERGRSQPWVGEPGMAEDRNEEEQAVARDWGYGEVDATKQPLWSLFAQHLGGHPFLGYIDDLKGSFRRYEEACRAAYSRLVASASHWTPPLQPGEAPSISEAILLHAFDKASGGEPRFPSRVFPSKAPDGSDIWTLGLGAWAIQRPSRGEVENLQDSFARAVEDAATWDDLADAAREQASFCSSAAAFRVSLSPNAMLRKLLAQGHCPACL